MPIQARDGQTRTLPEAERFSLDLLSMSLHEILEDTRSDSPRDRDGGSGLRRAPD